MNIVAVNPLASQGAIAAAWFIAINQAQNAMQDATVPINEIHIIESDGTQAVEIPRDRPLLFELARSHTNSQEILVGMGLSYADGTRSKWSNIIGELTTPKVSLQAMTPSRFDQRVAFLVDIIRGLIKQGDGLLEATRRLKGVRVRQVGDFNLAHLPEKVDKVFSGQLMKIGADVVTYANGEAIGFKVSKEAQARGLSARHFEGFPSHWHDEVFSLSHGSKKAPRPIGEAGMSCGELRQRVASELERLSESQEAA